MYFVHILHKHFKILLLFILFIKTLNYETLRGRITRMCLPLTFKRAT